MQAVCRRFARGILDESRIHIMGGGFPSSNWAKWASLTHTSGNSIKVLRDVQSAHGRRGRVR
eukprot:4492527-Pleurochrysis_carterae.AAC.1